MFSGDAKEKESCVSNPLVVTEIIVQICSHDLEFANTTCAQCGIGTVLSFFPAFPKKIPTSAVKIVYRRWFIKKAILKYHVLYTAEKRYFVTTCFALKFSVQRLSNSWPASVVRRIDK